MIAFARLRAGLKNIPAPTQRWGCTGLKMTISRSYALPPLGWLDAIGRDIRPSVELPL